MDRNDGEFWRQHAKILNGLVIGKQILELLKKWITTTYVVAMKLIKEKLIKYCVL